MTYLFWLKLLSSVAYKNFWHPQMGLDEGQEEGTVVTNASPLAEGMSENGSIQPASQNAPKGNGSLKPDVREHRNTSQPILVVFIYHPECMLKQCHENVSSFIREWCKK